MESYQDTTQPSILRTGLNYGLILGLSLIGSSLLIIAFGSNPYAGNWWQMLISPAAMIAIIVLAQPSVVSYEPRATSHELREAIHINASTTFQLSALSFQPL